MSKWIQDPDMLEPSLIEVEDCYAPGEPLSAEEARLMRCCAWIIFIIEGIVFLILDIKKFGW